LAVATVRFTYTCYADDLTFSGPGTTDVGAMLDRIRSPALSPSAARSRAPISRD